MRRLIIVSGAALAAALIVLGGTTTRWWSQSDGDLTSSIGLRGVSMCRPQGCAHTALESLERDLGWIRAGYAAYAAALLLGGLLLAVAVTAAARRPGRLLPRTTGVAALAALVAGVAFVVTAPGYEGMTPSYSMLSYFTGATLGGAVALAAPRPPAAG